MSDTATGKPSSPPPPLRTPRVFRIEDVIDENEPTPGSAGAGAVTSRRSDVVKPRVLTATDLNRGIRWGGIFVSAAGALASLAATLWFTRFVSVAIERNDWIGWLAFTLLSAMALAAVVLLGRELWGFRNLARLSRLRKAVKAATEDRDPAREKAAVALLVDHYAEFATMAWGVARLKDHKDDVFQPGERLRLADRELLSPVDQDSRRVILKSAKRVATVTALSPMMWIAVIFVMIENVRMFRTIAGLYGGRPGLLGAMRLARLVVTHIIATGGIAMTDDLLGQFLGQDMLRRVSRRLGEGAFNGALTARLGVAAVEVTRPLPFLDAEPLRVREIFGELMRSLRSKDQAGDDPANPKA